MTMKEQAERAAIEGLKSVVEVGAKYAVDYFGTLFDSPPDPTDLLRETARNLLSVANKSGNDGWIINVIAHVKMVRISVVKVNNTLFIQSPSVPTTDGNASAYLLHRNRQVVGCAWEMFEQGRQMYVDCRATVSLQGLTAATLTETIRSVASEYAVTV